MTLKKQFVNPHQHSDHSFDGAATVQQIITRSQELGVPYIALTEHGNLNSAMEFYYLCKQNNIKPILGIEAYIEAPFKDEIRKRLLYDAKDTTDKTLSKIEKKVIDSHCHLTILFKDAWAYQYFCRLTPKMEANAIVRFGNRKPLLAWQDLEGASGHIVLCSGCLASPVHKWIQPWRGENRLDLAEKIYIMLREIAGQDNFFVEIFPNTFTHTWKPPQYNMNKQLITNGQFIPLDRNILAPDGDYQKLSNRAIWQIAKKYNDRCLISLDAHYAYKQQKIIQDARLSNGQEHWKFYEYYHILTTQEAANFLMHSLDLTESEITQMVENSYQFASLFDNFTLLTNKDRWILPAVSNNALSILNQLISKYQRMNWNDSVMVERLQKELNVIINNKYINLLPYFFILEEIVDFCTKNNILINVRGSAGGSLLLFLIGVSSINPIKHNLSFERFLTIGRIKSNKLPDVDIDISSGGREQVFQFLKEKYGDAFCQLSIDSTLKLKSSIRDAERTIYGAVRKETEALCKTLPQEPQNVSSRDIVFGYVDNLGNPIAGLINTHDKFKQYINHNPKVWEMVVELLGIQRQKSIHACGCVIADRPVYEYCPVIKINDTFVTGFSPKSIEIAGLIKYDILGVNTLYDIQNCLLYIQQRHNITLNPWQLPYEQKVFNEFCLGHTETVFQFDTDTVRPYLIEIQPQNIEDLIMITSLCRPGTLDAIGADGRTLAEIFVARRRGEPIQYIHADLEPILGCTMGIQLFQEQTLQIFRDIAHFSFEEAEEVRQAIGKKESKLLEIATKRLKYACLERNWTEEQAQLLIHQIMASARYAFNKSHATSYAYVAYACMYLKTFYPLEWYKALLSNTSKEKVATKYWKHIKSFFAFPNIKNLSMVYEIQDNKLIAPISLITGIGEQHYKSLIEYAPYHDFQDFIKKHFTNTKSSIHSGLVRKLIIANVLDPLFPNSNLTITEKLQLFEQIKADVTNKPINPIPSEYIGITKLGEYLIKKELLDIYSEDLRSIILMPRGGKQIADNLWQLQDKTLIVNAAQLQHIKTLINEGKWNGNKIGALGYVIKETAIMYQNKLKQATKLLIDLGDDLIEEILWPTKENNTAEFGFQNQIILITYWIGAYKIGVKSIIKLTKKTTQSKYTMI